MKFGIRLSVILLTLSCSAAARAQYEYSGMSGADGTGTVVIQRLPQSMRLHITILSKSATTKGAVVGLKHRVDNARKKVTALGAKPESIKVEPFKIMSSADNNGNVRHMRRMMRMRMQMQQQPGQKKKEEDKPEPPKPIMMACNFIADFPLSSKQQEDLVVESKTLQDSIREAKLSGKEAAYELTDAEKKDHEEMVNAGICNDDSEQAGDPMFMFVNAVSDGDYKQALGEAFKKAQADAAMFAKAAGFELGPMRTVSRGYEQPEDIDYNELNSGSSQWAMNNYRTITAQAKTNEVREALGSAPVPVKYTVRVSVGYVLKPSTK